MKQIPIVPFPYGAESNGFMAALASAILPCLGITADTPYYCAPKGSHCIHCSGCDPLCKHQEMLYHTLLTASGLAFTFDYPEDDNVSFHTLPNIPVGWRWEEPFVSDLMSFAGLAYTRYVSRSILDMRNILLSAIDAGYPALCANHGPWKDEAEWARCWNIVCGYTDEGLLLMRHGGQVVVETDSLYDDWIVITGHIERKASYHSLLEKIAAILSHSSHDALEREIMEDLGRVTPENAVSTVFKMLGINGVPIEARWHAAEASIYVDKDCRRAGLGRLLYSELEKCLRMQNIVSVSACIAACDREHDEHLTQDSLLFHARCGYKEVGRHPNCGYKFGKWYHLVWMEKSIGERRADMPEMKFFPEIKESISF